MNLRPLALILFLVWKLLAFKDRSILVSSLDDMHHGNLSYKFVRMYQLFDEDVDEDDGDSD
nr:11654_t:CDS:2 [Entrophospora candida]